MQHFTANRPTCMKCSGILILDSGSAIFSKD